MNHNRETKNLAVHLGWDVAFIPDGKKHRGSEPTRVEKVRKIPGRTKPRPCREKTINPDLTFCKQFVNQSNVAGILLVPVKIVYNMAVKVVFVRK